LLWFAVLALSLILQLAAAVCCLGLKSPSGSRRVSPLLAGGLLLAPLPWVLPHLVAGGGGWAALSRGVVALPTLISALLLLTGAVALRRLIRTSLASECEQTLGAERFVRAFAASPGPVAVTSLTSGALVDVNDAALSLFGYSREEVLGRTTLELALWLTPGDRVKLISQVPESGEPFSSEMQLRRRDGRIVPLLISMVRMNLKGAPYLVSSFVDLTERKGIEEGLRASERHLANIVNSLPEATFVLDREGRILAWNRAAEAMTGCSSAEMVGKGDYQAALAFWGERVPILADLCLQDQPTLPSRYTGLHWEGDALVADETLPRLRGRATPVWAKATRLRDDDGNIVGSIESVRDISALKAVQTGLQEANRRLHAFIDASPMSVVAMDGEGRLTLWNAGAERTFGWTAEEVLGGPPPFAQGPGMEEFKGFLRRVMEGEALSDVEVVRVRKDGASRTLRFWAAPLRGSAGEVTGSIGVIEDLTDRRTREAAHGEVSARFEALFRNMPAAVFLMDPHDREIPSRIVDCNPAACAMNGYTREELLGTSVADLSVPRSSREEVLSSTQAFVEELRRHGHWSGEGIHRHKDGSAVHIETVACLVTVGGQELIMGVDRDVTEERHLEAQLMQSQKMEAVGQLAGGVAHDFNNLLTAILGYSQILQESLDPDSGGRRSAREIEKAAARAAALTQQLLAFSRKQILEPRVLNLNSVVAEMGRLLRRLIGEHIELQTRLQPGLARVKADPGQIDQVLLNLVVNARDAMPQGGRLLIETSNVHLDQEFTRQHPESSQGPHVMLSVTDTGCGIPPELVPRVFEPFFTTKEKGKGTGLGLSTVYGIVKQSGGSLWIRSEPGSGTTFRVYLPAEPTEGSQDVAPVDGPRLGGSETLLVVEDEDVLRSLMCEVLTAQGYHVLQAASGDQALDLCIHGGLHPDLLVTDVVMPGMNGRELAERLKDELPGLPVLFLSGYTEDAIVHHGVLEQGVNFLAKPFSPQALAGRVRDVLDKQGSVGDGG
jgi:PAS domain S-box-containing protein